MPTLGFLKKKKTRENDPHAPPSPVEQSHSVLSDHASTTTTLAPSSSHVSDKTTETLVSANNGQPTAVSAPRGGGDEPAAVSGVPLILHLLTYPCANTDGNPQVDAAAAPETDGHTNGTNSMNHTPVVPRSTKGKYSIGDFRINRTLGTGSFGRVHLVQSNHNQRYYAVKVLKKAQVVKMKQVEHTNDERKMLTKVKHPFLVTLWGTFQDSANLFMVMDFVEGGELFSLLRKSQVWFQALVAETHTD